MKGLALVLLLKLTFAVAKSEIEDLNGENLIIVQYYIGSQVVAKY